MKKIIIAAAFFLFTGVAFGQTVQKGSVVGVHTSTVTLNSGVTLDQYLDYFTNKLIPEFENNFPGAKLFLVKGLNREVKGEYGSIIIVESKKVYNKYWNDDGSYTDVTLAIAEKMQPIVDEGNKLGTSTDVITDWVIQ
jgi:hypothetical protein